MNCREISADSGLYSEQRHEINIKSTSPVRLTSTSTEFAHFVGYVFNIHEKADFTLENVIISYEINISPSYTINARKAERVDLKNVKFTLGAGTKAVIVNETRIVNILECDFRPNSIQFTSVMDFTTVELLTMNKVEFHKTNSHMTDIGSVDIDRAFFNQSTLVLGLYGGRGVPNFHIKNSLFDRTGVPNRSAIRMYSSTGFMGNVTISNINVGYDHYGGAMLIQNSHLKMEDVHLLNNKVPVHGGGFWCDVGSVHMTRGSLQKNWSRRGGSCDCNRCNTTFTDVLFKDNTYTEQKSRCQGVPEK